MSIGLRQYSQIGHLDLVHLRNCSAALLSDVGCRNRNESGCREVWKNITSSGPVQNWSSSCVWQHQGSFLCLVLSPLIQRDVSFHFHLSAQVCSPPEVTFDI